MKSGPRWIRSMPSPARSRPHSASPKSAKLAWRPQNEVTVTGDDAATLMKLLDALEDDDDVQTVSGNYNVPDEELERLGLTLILGLDPGLGTTGWGLIRAEATACRMSPTAS